MANRTDASAETVHGANPQYLVDRIIRNKIYNDAYWKEFCFGLTTESLIDEAAKIDYVGGTYGGRRRPAKFLCLFLKMLQIQPDEDVILEYIKQPELKYLRALGAAYWRISQRHIKVYSTLEPLYADYRKLRYRDIQGKLSLIHMDEFIDWLFQEKTVCDVTMPGIPKREILEETLEMPPRESILDDDLEDLEELEGQAAGADSDGDDKGRGTGGGSAPSGSSGGGTCNSAGAVGGDADVDGRGQPAAESQPALAALPAVAERSRSSGDRVQRRRRSRTRSRSLPARSRSECRDRRAKADKGRDERRQKLRARSSSGNSRREKAPKSKAKKEKWKTERKEPKEKKGKKDKDKVGDQPKDKNKKDGLSVAETNELRKSLGLKPLQ